MPHPLTLRFRLLRTEVASDGLKGRVYEVSLADLNRDEDQAFRKMRFRCEEVQGRNCLLNFWGMSLTTDKLRSMVRKWQTLIEAFADVKTTDGYVLRLFCIGFTKRRPNQLKKTSYAQSSQIRAIRAKMVEIIQREVASGDMKALVKKLYVFPASARPHRRQTLAHARAPVHSRFMMSSSKPVLLLIIMIDTLRLGLKSLWTRLLAHPLATPRTCRRRRPSANRRNRNFDPQHPGGHRQGHREGVPGHLPPAQRFDPQGQGSPRPEVRPAQAP